MIGVRKPLKIALIAAAPIEIVSLGAGFIAGGGIKGPTLDSPGLPFSAHLIGIMHLPGGYRLPLVTRGKRLDARDLLSSRA